MRSNDKQKACLVREARVFLRPYSILRWREIARRAIYRRCARRYSAIDALTTHSLAQCFTVSILSKPVWLLSSDASLNHRWHFADAAEAIGAALTYSSAL